MQLGNSAALTREESAALFWMVIPQSEPSNFGDEGLSISKQAIKRKRYSLSGLSVAYMDGRFLHPTANVSERLFSIAWYTLDSRQKAILPSNLDLQILLNQNSELWSQLDISKIVEWINL